MAQKQFKNIIGTNFTDYVKKQLENRKKLISTSKRGNKDLLWLTNRNTWYRVTSFAVVPGVGDSLKFRKDNILQGGLLGTTNSDNNSVLRKGFGAANSQAAYIKGPLGYKPMPGITNLSVGTGGRWQSLLEGSFDYIAYDIDQLDTVNKLYMSLGVHLLIEWGHIPYINSDGVVDTGKNIKPLNVFDFKNRRAILKAISLKTRNLAGNYGAILGRVSNFDYTANPDGSYSCNTKIMGPGGMVDSLKVNRGEGYDNDVTADDSQPKFSSDLENALITFRNTATLILDPKKSSHQKSYEEDEDKIQGELKVINLSNFSEVKKTGWFEKLPDSPYYKTSMLAAFDSIYRRFNPPFTFGAQGISYNDSDNLAEFGNAHQLVSGIGEGEKEFVKPNPIGFNSLFKVYASDLVTTKDEDVKASAYITFGHLLCLIQNICVPKEQPVNGNSTRPILYIDYHPDNTLCKVGTVDASIDPTICLVPFRGTNREYENLLNGLEVTKKEPYPFQSSKMPNFEKNPARKNKADDTEHIFNRVNMVISPQFRSGNSGKIMNVLVNIDFAISTLKVLRENSAATEVLLREYIQSILNGINKSLGGLNNLKATIDDCSHTLRIIDLNFVPDKNTIKYLTIPPFGTNSIAYDYSYSSKISKNLAAQVVIASQAEDKGIEDFPSDVLSFNKLNGGVKDFLSEQIKLERFVKSQKDKLKQALEGDTPTAPSGTTASTTEIPTPISPEERQKLKALRGPQIIFNQIYNIYSLTNDEKINSRLSRSLYSSYNQLQQKALNKKSKGRKGSGGKVSANDIGVLMPIELSITIDGISGILPYTAFELPDNILPKKYRGNVAFVIFSINHDFDNNRWTTTLRGQTIIKPT
tara:strand:+ start:215 stop:2812 length:2598 start_codon:yes stop_codon:yes gene_type:complete